MESPSKKRKILSQESQASKVTSTPQRRSETCRVVSPAISLIADQDSSSSSSPRNVLYSAKRLNFPIENSNDNNKAVVSDRSSLLDVLEKSNSVADTIEEEDGDHLLDYDEFFSKLTRFYTKGFIWNLYKPIGEEGGSLYHQIVTNPREAGDKANWFVTYCLNIPMHVASYVIYKFCLDCAGYQKFNIKKYFTNPLPPIPTLVGAIISKADSELCEAEVFTTGKFLFADKSRLGKILQMGIFNFTQKFVLEAHDQEILYGELFIRLLKFVEAMCKASFRQLMYTGTVFVVKLLTAICMVKANIPDSTLGGRQQMMLDNYINTLYLIVVKACRSPDHECASLKLTCLNELRIWINYSAKVFLDHYNCINTVGKLAIDEVKSVRLAALEAFQKMVQNEHLVDYLQAGPIEHLTDSVFSRFCDVDVNIALKALEVYTSMITHHFNIIQKKKNIFEVLMESIYHTDYRMGSAACKSVIHILNQEDNDEKTSLLNICKIGMNFYPNLKPLLVESCMDHTNLLQNWSLIIEILDSPHCKDISVELKSTLSELFLESVHQVLTGISSKVRQFSRRVKEVILTEHKRIADELYPHLKALLVMNRKQPVIAGNILKILTKIKPEYLSKDHVEFIEQFLQYLMKFFALWNNAEELSALLDYLVYINEYIPRLSATTRNTTEDLKKYVSEELYKSFKSRDIHTVTFAKKTSIVFSKFDMNDHIEWSKLLISWDIIESNLEFLEDMMTCCHWSLIWRIRKLSSSQFSKAEQNKEVSSLINMSKAFFSNCLDILGHQDQVTKFKVFERICESCITFSMGLENISKQIRALEELKPFLKDASTQKQIMDVFELTVGNCADSVAQKYAMYIVNMALLNILPLESISSIIKYYDKCYQTYGKLVESICSLIFENNDNWIPLLLVNTICDCLERLITKHGAVEVRSQEAKDILSLSRKLAEYKKTKNPKIASKLLFYAINYAVDRRSYELLIFVRVFIDEIQNYPDMRREILEHLKKKVPKADYKQDPILYFGEHLIRTELKASDVSKAPAKKLKGRPPKVLQPPKLKIKTTKVKKPTKSKEDNLLKKPSQSTESEVSDDMTIHDTSSDDLDVTISNLSISQT